MCIIIFMSALQHSKTTQSLISHISKVKEGKQAIADRLQASIARSSELLEERARFSRNYNPKTLIKRQSSIDVLQNRLLQKKKADQISNCKLTSAELDNQRRRSQLERRIEEIGNRNLRRLSQLKQVEQRKMQKIQEQFNRNQIRERSLREEYNRIKREETKVRQTVARQGRQAGQQWRVLRQEKWRIEEMVRQREERQEKLVVERSPEIRKRQQKRKEEKGIVPTEKEYNKLKVVNGNAKEVGNKYLQQIKLLQRQVLVNKKKKKLMNLNLKVINYNPQVLERIIRSTNDLSKIGVQPAMDQNEQTKTVFAPPAEIKIEKSVPKPQSDLLMAEDLQTERYLKQIKLNLQQLQRINKTKEQNSYPKSQLNLLESESLVIPSTMQQV